MTLGSIILAGLGWLADTLLPAFLAKRWGKARARAEQAEEAAHAAKTQNQILRDRLAESDADFIERLR